MSTLTKNGVLYKYVYTTADELSRFVDKGFKRRIGNDGSFNQYGFIALAKYSTKYPSIRYELLPVICGDGGSQWLCYSCAERIMKEEK